MMLGWSSWSESDIVLYINTGGSIDNIPGDFLIVEESSPKEVRFIASVVSVLPYFYTIMDDGKIVHANNIFNIVLRAGIPWEWNSKALSDVALFGHTIGLDSLHSRIFRVPGCGIYTIRKNKMNAKPSRFWTETAKLSGGNSDKALQVAQQVFKEQLNSKQYLLSLTAGFDSRLLLGLALDQGHLPNCATMGKPTSTDQNIAASLCSKNDLEHQQVILHSSDYSSHAKKIIQLTSGTKKAADWHSYIYGIKGKFDPNQLHVVGSNGEFARSFFFNYSTWPVFKKMPISVMHMYWTARQYKRLSKHSSAWKFLSKNLGAVRKGVNNLTSLAPEKSDLLTMLDQLYCTQRVRHFIGNGLQLMSQSGMIRSPFLDARWIRAVAALPRKLKIDNRWHLDSIKKLDPSLLELPFNGFTVEPVSLKLKKSHEVKGYNAFLGFSKDEELLEKLEATNELDVFISKKERCRVLKEASYEDINLMITLYFATLEASVFT